MLRHYRALNGVLDDAYQLGLLRIAAPVCQFRYAALQDHLVTTLQADTGRQSAHAAVVVK